MAGWRDSAVRRRRLAAVTGAVVLLPSLLLTVQPAFAKQPDVGPVEVSAAIHSDVSEPVRDLVGVAPAAPDDKDHEKDKPLRPLPNQGNALKQPDGAVQGSASASAPATPGLGFAGVGQGDYGFSDQYAPPDTNGAVGATQYVQWVNTYYAVFDKATGAIVQGFPKAGNSIWSGFGGGCQTNNDGDPIVQYDQLAQRWILTQFSVSTTPYLQCVAVSTSPDATGSYYRYSFSYGTTQFNDYPKLGVWPDGYYVSYNIFNNGKTFAGSKVCALERAKLLVGDASATQQCFQLGTAYGGLLPSDLDGSTPPPAGAPNPFLNFGSNVLNRWQFHVDWTTPASSTFSGPTTIPVSSFSPACSGGGTCIPQPNTTQQLDSLADRLMYRLAYRNFGDHEALVVNHAVTAGSSVGVRWYEIRNPNGTPSVFQQGTYAPDATYRWMGSVAMDATGDIALGYSGSSSSVAPYIAWAGRVPTDPAGTLSAETVVKSGGGSQKCPNFLVCTSLSRWGDYSAMSVDPVDDCTFWYTNEYEKTTGAFNWSTWITSFKFPGCSTDQTPVLTSIAVAPASATVQTGGTQQYSATAKDQFGQPMSPQPSFTWSVSGGGAIDGTGLFTAGSTPGGPFTVTASTGGVSGTAGVTVTQPPVLTSITVSPASASVQTGATQPFTATAKDQFGQPMSPQPSFAWSVSGGGTISASGLFTAGSTAGGPFTVTASSGGVSGTASVTVTQPPAGDFSLTPNPTSRSIRQGSTTTYAVTIARVNGFTGSVTFAVSGLPSGATASFSPNPATGTSSTLTVRTASGARGTFTLTITGTSGSLQHTTTVKLSIKGG